jgi:nitroimidazol reductase NimA-like FMN-containing flavoprotein (pyridoxamine 5'-phosphate oxidase superfamily)
MPDRSPAALSRETCLALLGTRSLGRLIFTYRALPDVLPVLYRLEGEDVLLRLSLGSVAVPATRGAVVAFETDDVDPLALTGWSVTIVGQAHELIGRNPAGLGSLAGGGRDHYFRVAAEKITGHRLTGA